MSIYSNFKAQQKTIPLPSPHGSLSKVEASSTIEVPNRELKQLIENESKDSKNRGLYMYTPNDKDTVGNYTIHVYTEWNISFVNSKMSFQT